MNEWMNKWSTFRHYPLHGKEFVFSFSWHFAASRLDKQYFRTQFVPHSKHRTCTTQANQWILFRETILAASCPDTETKHINTYSLCGQMEVFMNAKPGNSNNDMYLFIVNLQYISVDTTILWYIYLASIKIYNYFCYMFRLLWVIFRDFSRTIVHIALQFLCLTVFFSNYCNRGPFLHYKTRANVYMVLGEGGCGW